MFSRFQHIIATSPTSLHTVSVVVVIAWLIIGSSSPVTYDSVAGLWTILPSSIHSSGWVNTMMAILTMVLSVYVIGELSRSHILLRINSRSISFLFAALVISCKFIHAFQPGYIVMMALMLSYFSLFNAYQLDNSAGHSFVSFLYLGIAVCLYPKFIWLCPIYFISLYLLRAINPRSISASLLGLFTPLWIVGSAAYCTGKWDNFTNLMERMISFHWGGYSTHSTSQTMMIWLLFAIFMIGTIDFYIRIYLDKNRTRILYHIMVLHGFAYYLLLLLQPLSCETLLPVVIMNTSIIGGHYIANDDTPLTNIIVIMMTIFISMSLILNTWIL